MTLESLPLTVGGVRRTCRVVLGPESKGPPRGGRVIFMARGRWRHVVEVIAEATGEILTLDVGPCAERELIAELNTLRARGR